MTLLLANVPFFMVLVGFLWFLAAVLLILLILIQKGKGGGLGAAFGGAGSNSLLGTKTGDFLTWVTISLTAIFLLVGIVMAKFYKPRGLKGLQEDATTSVVDTSALFDELESQSEQKQDGADTALPEQSQNESQSSQTEQTEQPAQPQAAPQAPPQANPAAPGEAPAQ